MAITINWGTKVIMVPRGEPTVATQTSVTPEIWEIDMDAFRLILKDLEDSEDGIPFEDTHRHNTEVVVSGITLARSIEIINGYTVEFADGQYAVTLVGANTNVADVAVVNQVSIRPINSAGLVTVQTPALVTASEIADAVWTEQLTDHSGVAGSTAEALTPKVLPEVKQAWTMAQDPTTLVSLVHLELDGEVVNLPGTASLSITMRNAAGAVVFVVAGLTANAQGYFSVSQAYTPVPGINLAAFATITNGADSYSSVTPISFPEFVTESS